MSTFLAPACIARWGKLQLSLGWVQNGLGDLAFSRILHQWCSPSLQSVLGSKIRDPIIGASIQKISRFWFQNGALVHPRSPEITETPCLQQTFLIGRITASHRPSWGAALGPLGGSTQIHLLNHWRCTTGYPSKWRKLQKKVNKMLTASSYSRAMRQHLECFGSLTVHEKKCV